AIPYWALIDDYSRGDVRVRTRLSNAQGVGVLLATGVGFVLSPKLIDAWGFLGGSIAFAVAGASFMALPYFAAPRGPRESTGRQELPPLATLLGALRDRRF